MPLLVAIAALVLGGLIITQPGGGDDDVSGAVASNLPRNAESLGSFSGTGDLVNTSQDYDYTRVPDGFDETDLGLPPDMSAWADIDVTDSTEMDSISCAAEAVADSGTTDDDDAGILCCMASGAAGSRRCHLPAGEYWVNSTLAFTVGNRQLYGDGIGSTIIRLASTDQFPLQVGSDSGGASNEDDWASGTAVTWTAGFTKGTTILTFSAITGMVPGDFVELRCTPFDSCIPANSTFDNGGGIHNEIARLTCVGTSGTDDCGSLSATQVKLSMGLVEDFETSGTTRTAAEITAARQIGIHGITWNDEYIGYAEPGGSPEADRTFNASTKGIYYGRGAVLAFITDNAFLRGAQPTIYFVKTAFSLFSGNYVENMIDISSGSCFTMLNTHRSVIVNNIFECPVGIEFNQQPSGVHNVIAYNYLPNPPRRDDPCTSQTDITCDCIYMGAATGACHPTICDDAVSGCDCTNYSGTGSIGRGLLFHGPNHRANIMEGNDGTCRWEWDEVPWGAAGRYNTFYRNRLRQIGAVDADPHPTNTNMRPSQQMVGRVGTDANAQLVMFNFLGNFVAQTKSDSETAFEGSITNNTEMSSWSERNISYDLCHIGQSTGTRDASCGTASGTTDPTAMWAYNLVASQAPSTWTDDETWPTSLVYDAEPAWWDTPYAATCPWAAVGGIGAFGDVEPTGTAGTGVGSIYANGLANLCKIPAQVRYETGAHEFP